MLFLVYVSVGFAGIVFAAMLLLIGRRWRGERHAAHAVGRANDVTRAYLRRVGGVADVLPPEPGAIARDAVLHLTQLLRGPERDRLLALAEADGLFDAALVRVKRAHAPGRVKAIRMLAQFGSERCIASLRQAMADDPRAELRLEAAGALAQLGQLPSPAETIALLGMAHRTPTRLHLALLRSLAPAYAQKMGALLDEPLPPALRCMIVEAIGCSGDYAAADLIERASREGDPDMRCAALRAARELGRPDAGRWIVTLLADESADVRVNAIRACAALHIRRANDALELLCRDPSWWVRARAEQALVTLRARGPASVAA